MHDYKAIPTMYKGVQYRSRLEARWAAMFDRIGWACAYEPFDLNGYIPDFVGKTARGEDVNGAFDEILEDNEDMHEEDSGFLRYANTDDDGPSVHIETVEIE